jgi:hypothetical protein
MSASWRAITLLSKTKDFVQRTYISVKKNFNIVLLSHRELTDYKTNNRNVSNKLEMAFYFSQIVAIRIT